jgi:ribosomal protein S19
MIKKNNLKVWARREIISSSFIEKTVFIHNGKEFKKIFIKREHVGFKFGEFCLTKKHKIKLKKK